MKSILIPVATLGLMISGCFYTSVPTTPVPVPLGTPASVTMWGPTGGFAINAPMCAGQAALDAGKMTVNEPCFTSMSNVVLCTNTTSATPVRCSASPGALHIDGTGNDVISYARVR